MTQPILSNRRDFFKTVGLTAATAALPSSLLASGAALAQPATDLITRKIPRSGEVLPAIGLGTYLTFDLLPGAPRNNIRDVMKIFWEGGGRVFDTSPLYGSGEISVGDFATSMGINEQMFICNKIWSTGEFLADDSHARKSFEQSQQRLWREKIDVMQVHSLVNVDQIVPVLKNWKTEGKIRYVGVTHHEVPYFAALAGHVERGDLDFVQVHYSIQMRRAKERILPAALDKGTAVLVNMPFEKTRLFKLVQGHALPSFAKEMRARMVKHMETIPGFDKLQETPAYPGKAYNGLIRRAMAARANAAK